jgi:hypothetical protein
LSLNLFNASLAFVKSAQYDVKALSDTLLEAHERIHSYLKCSEVWTSRREGEKGEKGEGEKGEGEKEREERLMLWLDYI